MNKNLKVGDVVKFVPDAQSHLEWLEDHGGPVLSIKIGQVNEDYNNVELDILFKETGWEECGETWDCWMFEKISE